MGYLSTLRLLNSNFFKGEPFKKLPFGSFAGPPDAPTNCSVVNQTTDSLDVQCLAGFDGGTDQHFLLEVADLQTGLLLANASDKTPEFRVSVFKTNFLLSNKCTGTKST